ncbi:hypothetical protein DB347_03820 [Opitutaceae bacterium EW11]|nr:hypothetical protein DB347_03820 [Opitutaceae bacterium EW11]
MSAFQWRGWLVALAIFILGTAVGATVMASFGIRAFRRAMQAPEARIGFADRAAARMGADLKTHLNLTPEEAEQVQALLNESARNMRALRVRMAAQAAAELRASTARIAASLPPEKRPEFYRLIAKRYHRLGLPAPTPEAAP